MNFENVLNTIINEPIYLSITLLFLLIIIYSVLKKFFKILLITLIILLLYISYLIYTGSDLPGDTENVITPIIDNAGDIIEQIGEEIKKITNNINDK